MAALPRPPMRQAHNAAWDMEEEEIKQDADEVHLGQIELPDGQVLARTAKLDLPPLL